MLFFCTSLVSVTYIVLSWFDKYLPPHMRIGKNFPFQRWYYPIGYIPLSVIRYSLYFFIVLKNQSVHKYYRTFLLPLRIILFIGIGRKLKNLI